VFARVSAAIDDWRLELLHVSAISVLIAGTVFCREVTAYVIVISVALVI